MEDIADAVRFFDRASGAARISDASLTGLLASIHQSKLEIERKKEPFLSFIESLRD